MIARNDELRETLVAIYHVEELLLGKVGSLYKSKQPAITLKDALNYIANPNKSFYTMSASAAFEKVYPLGSKYLGLDKGLRIIFLPPCRLATTCYILEILTSGVARFTPNVIRQIIPVDIMANDVSIVLSTANYTMNLGKKVKTCITHAGEIAKATIVEDMSEKTRSGFNGLLEPHIPAPLPEPTQTSSWGSIIRYIVNKAVHATATAAASGTANVAKYAGNKTLDVCVNRLNKQVDQKEYEQLSKLSALVVDNGAKWVFTQCVWLGATWATSSYIVPNVTKWGFGCVMGETAAELVSTGMQWLSYGLIAYSKCSTIYKYSKDRQQNTEILSALPLDDMKDIGVVAVEKLTEKMNNIIPTLGNKFTLFQSDKFVARCKNELPGVFAGAGR